MNRVRSQSPSVIRWLRQSYPFPLVVFDTVGFVLAFFVAGLRRNEVGLGEASWTDVGLVGLVGILAFVSIGWPIQLYRSRHRVASFDDVLCVCLAWVFSLVIAVAVNRLLLSPSIPTMVVEVAMVVAVSWMMLSRAAWRLFVRSESRPDPEGRTRVLVFGAGEGGTQVIKSMLGDAQSRYVPVGVLDDDARKQNRVIEGVHVIGTSNDVQAHSSKADLLLIAVPSASADLIGHLADEAAEADLDVLILPTTTELLGMMGNIEAARPLEITDLLGRDEVEIDAESVRSYLENAVVLVTGAGGSIGSELCRQILRYDPAELVMLDRDETALQEVQLSVAGHGLLDDDNLVLADIRDRARVFEVFAEHKPQIVFHAAALKHLPLLQSHPREGLLTNVFGSNNVLEAARSVGVTRFVNVSTDKAADPTSVLGTTKRVAEALTFRTGAEASGEYLSVRFGNVIGSRGSVLPAFEKQIAAGGPITVTHPDVTRFFMSIPEASRLVLQAGAYGKTGETLILDMNEPMKIVDLAKRLLKHYKSDAEIVFTGLRPNEKLHEVLSHGGEVMTIGPHPRIWHADASKFLGSDGIEHLLEVEAAELPGALLEWCQVDRVAELAGD